MALIVASPETRRYAVSIADETGSDLIDVSQFRGIHTGKRKVFFIGKNGDKHHKDLANIERVKYQYSII